MGKQGGLATFLEDRGRCHQQRRTGCGGGAGVRTHLLRPSGVRSPGSASAPRGGCGDLRSKAGSETEGLHSLWEQNSLPVTSAL